MNNIFSKITYNQARRLAGATVDKTFEHPEHKDPITFKQFWDSHRGNFLKSDVREWRYFVKRGLDK